MNNATEIGSHRCFPADLLSDYQLGKLNFEWMQRIETQVYSCLECRLALELLDEVSDETTLLVAANISTKHFYARDSKRGEMNYSASKTPILFEYQPQKFGQYKLLRPIGRGGMGSVWLAKHDSLEREVAVKLLPIHLLACEKTQSRFMREMSAHGQLNHNNLVRAHDAGEIDGIPYLAMELLDGEDATVFCTVKRMLPISEACEIVRQAAIGVSHAHSKESIHRDIKPSNLRVTSDGTVKVLDMGLARMIDQSNVFTEDTAANQILGTVDYMAPEQFCDPTNVDARADIYSLGCTLFHLLTGRLPFESQCNQGIISKAVQKHAESPLDARKYRKGIPSSLHILLSSALNHDPNLRPRSAQELAAKLKPFCCNADLRRFAANSMSEGDPVTNKAEISRLPKPSRRASRLRTAASMGVLFAALIGIVMWNYIFTSPRINNSAKFQSVAGLQSLIKQQPQVNHAHVERAAMIARYIEKFEIPGPLKSTLTQTIADHPSQNLWVERCLDDSKAALVIETIPAGTSAVFLPDAIKTVQAKALHELIRSEASSKLLASLGYDDPAAADFAIESAVRGGVVAGKVRPAIKLARHEQNTVMSIVVADRRDIHAAWVAPPTVKAIGGFYRSAILKRYKKRLPQKNIYARFPRSLTSAVQEMRDAFGLCDLC